MFWQGEWYNDGVLIGTGQPEAFNLAVTPHGSKITYPTGIYDFGQVTQKQAGLHH